MNYNECLKNIEFTSKLLMDLGFTVHNEKSVFTPTQEVTFLGFSLNLANMTLSLTNEKVNHFYEIEKKVLEK